MTARVFWDNEEQTILQHVYSGDVTPDDYYFIIDNSAEMIRSVAHTVHVIVDSRQVISRPANLSRIMRYADKHVPDNQGIRVLVGATLLMRVMVDGGRVFSPRLVRDVHFAETVEDARALIERLTTPSPAR